MNKQLKDIPYWEILNKAWRITWRNKNLWWLGFFISVSAVGTSFNSSSFSNKEQMNEGGKKLAQFITDNLHFSLATIIILSIICIAFVVAGILARGGLIQSLDNALAGKNVSLKEGWKFGRQNFLKILSIGLIIALFMLIILMILIVPTAMLFYNHSYLIGGILAFLAILIVVPLAILSYFLSTFGYLYAVLGKLSVVSAIENAYAIFSKNIGPSLIMGLIFLPINMVVGIATLIVLIPLGIVFLILGGLLYLLFQKIGIIIAVVIGIIIFLIIALTIKSIYIVFSQAVWQLFFQAIAKPKEEPVVEKVQEIETTKKLPDEGTPEGIQGIQ